MTSNIERSSSSPSDDTLSRPAAGPCCRLRVASRGACAERPRPRKLSIVIPALNERVNMPRVLATIPRSGLASLGYEIEVIVVDNASTDGTGEVAAALGARVIRQPRRGYGHAYHSGFAAATGDVIATGDADCTYPFDHLPGLLGTMADRQLDFLSTNRLGHENREAMKPSHRIGNRVLTLISRLFFRSPFRDSQSGMWVFRRHVWHHLDIRSGGMPFSQEIKNDAYVRGFRCGETPIEYRIRGGEVKLHAVRDGLRNLSQLAVHRARTVRGPANVLCTGEAGCVLAMAD
ncbi:glycosyltransferase family 2 protein [Amycolatopsis circi]|uniref:glycosyltransferase family 2 protein n=1 Tax=Amycolatopsis circi TaxID=871959 RepID=UPI000E23DE12|nr:glycosyltransferase family 2 protein [Amycolatopsis circi]